MLTNWAVALMGLVCLAMLALMCVPMTVGMIRRRRRRANGEPATAPPAAQVTDERTMGSLTHRPTAGSGGTGRPHVQVPETTSGEQL